MIGALAAPLRIYLCLEPTDMRKSFDGLAALVQQVLEHDPFSGAWFIFRNRRGDRLKALWWDGSGYCVLYKRLEHGTFPVPRLSEGTLRLEPSELALLLEGCDWRRLERRTHSMPQVAA